MPALSGNERKLNIKELDRGLAKRKRDKRNAMEDAKSAILRAHFFDMNAAAPHIIDNDMMPKKATNGEAVVPFSGLGDNIRRRNVLIQLKTVIRTPPTIRYTPRLIFENKPVFFPIVEFSSTSGFTNKRLTN